MEERQKEQESCKTLSSGQGQAVAVVLMTHSHGLYKIKPVNNPAEWEQVYEALFLTDGRVCHIPMYAGSTNQTQ